MIFKSMNLCLSPHPWFPLQWCKITAFFFACRLTLPCAGAVCTFAVPFSNSTRSARAYRLYNNEKVETRLFMCDRRYVLSSSTNTLFRGKNSDVRPAALHLFSSLMNSQSVFAQHAVCSVDVWPHLLSPNKFAAKQGTGSSIDCVIIRKFWIA